MVRQFADGSCDSNRTVSARGSIPVIFGAEGFRNRPLETSAVASDAFHFLLFLLQRVQIVISCSTSASVTWTQCSRCLWQSTFEFCRLRRWARQIRMRHDTRSPLLFAHMIARRLINYIFSSSNMKSNQATRFRRCINSCSCLTAHIGFATRQKTKPNEVSQTVPEEYTKRRPSNS